MDKEQREQECEKFRKQGGIFSLTPDWLGEQEKEEQMINYQEFKKQILKNWRVRFWYYVYKLFPVKRRGRRNER